MEVLDTMNRTYKKPKSDPAPPPKHERPMCPTCGKPLRPRMLKTRERVHDAAAFAFRVTRVWWGGAYKGYGHFCTLRCAAEYANTVVDQRDS